MKDVFRVLFLLNWQIPRLIQAWLHHHQLSETLKSKQVFRCALSKNCNSNNKTKRADNTIYVAVERVTAMKSAKHQPNFSCTLFLLHSTHCIEFYLTIRRRCSSVQHKNEHFSVTFRFPSKPVFFHSVSSFPALTFVPI